MMARLRIVQTEAGLAVLLDAETEKFLGVSAGDEVGLGMSIDGDLILRSDVPTLDQQLAHGRAFMSRYDKTFKALAKS